eukprot:TRINITY_DN21079_c0_g1_i7.p1 TRINITY_DN21079_c0_g1~~TRINITY_DN21079_c0_g1_i7.p1  ORF type:complete len:178 (+),score=14.08 TRINITY_DN21079_c0_g1_i7:458-991(+)
MGPTSPAGNAKSCNLTRTRTAGAISLATERSSCQKTHLPVQQPSKRLPLFFRFDSTVEGNVRVESPTRFYSSTSSSMSSPERRDATVTPVDALKNTKPRYRQTPSANTAITSSDVVGISSFCFCRFSSMLFFASAVILLAIASWQDRLRHARSYRTPSQTAGRHSNTELDRLSFHET